MLIVSPSSFPGFTGDSAYYLELVRSLGRKSLECILLCPKTDVSDDAFDRKMKDSGIVVRRVPVIPPRLAQMAGRGANPALAVRLSAFYLAEIVSLFLTLRRYPTRLCIMRHSILTLPVALVGRIKHLRILADGEVLSESITDSMPASRFTRRVLNSVENLAFRSYRFFRVSSETQSQMMRGRGFGPDRIVVASAGVTIANVPIYDLAAIPPFTFGFFGALERWQGVDFLIRSFRNVLNLVQSARLFIIGNGSLAKDLRRLAKDLGISESNVVFVPAVTREMLWRDYFRLFRVAVIPRPELGVPVSPIKLAEALAAGKPVVATAVGGIRENAGKGIILVPPEDENALANAMISLCGYDGAKLAEISSGALESARKFNIDEQTQKIMRVLLPDPVIPGRILRHTDVPSL